MLTLMAVWVTASGVYAITARDAAEYVILTAAAVGACGVVWRASLGVWRRCVKTASEWFEVQIIRSIRPFTEEMATIERRTRELVPNGGSSIADKVSRIELLYYSHAERSEAERSEMRRMLDDLTARVDDKTGP